MSQSAFCNWVALSVGVSFGSCLLSEHSISEIKIFMFSTACATEATVDAKRCRSTGWPVAWVWIRRSRARSFNLCSSASRVASIVMEFGTPEEAIFWIFLRSRIAFHDEAKLKADVKKLTIAKMITLSILRD